ncbi:YggS family pyridoxal phosphate-dependent enzyme [Nocardioides solisilvae]|uniref:YggS family pyridoxal phosphate-dependent enzyme n=1 Tax=Nocardioides solisilvae TaxID=1542435 RepID=UPI000D744E77|nr:YggS family pyridoxal phosphate-dependent enzyme [Nocardioides solisilvae]
MSRRDELARNLEVVRGRIAAACAAAGREDDVTLVVVTKFFPASDIELLHGLGVREVAENRHQEAAAKSAGLAHLDLRWHFVGGLQSNKAAAVAAYSHVVESVDRPKLLAPLARGAEAAGHRLDVLLQVSLDPAGSEHRSGVAPEGLDELASRVAGEESLRLAGLMAVAPLGEDPDEAFERLARVRGSFLAQHPEAGILSAGMSGDLEQAVRHGATHVRVGSAILGPRPEVL